MKWTDNKVKQLKELVDANKGWLEISKIMHTTPDVVRMKYRRTWGETGNHTGIRGDINLTSPIIGLFDIETLPMINYAWSMFDSHTSIEQIISPTGFLAWAGKFLNDSKIYSDVLTPKEAVNKDDKRITKSCWEFLSKCDIVVGHNIIDFDLRHVNTFFLKHKLAPLKPAVVDTLLIARKNFRFDSNKMGFINKWLGLHEKTHNNTYFPLWVSCHQGNKEALQEMTKYNQNDVLALEDLYYRIRPYIKNINFALYNETDTIVCPVCGGNKFESNGYYYTLAGKWESVRCTSCKAILRKKTNLLHKDKRKSLLINS